MVSASVIHLTSLNDGLGLRCVNKQGLSFPSSVWSCDKDTKSTGSHSVSLLSSGCSDSYIDRVTMVGPDALPAGTSA